MSALEPPLPRCRYYETPADETTQCPLDATYIILAPPVVVRLTPTPVWLDGERRSPTQTRLRPTPLYCRHHAYAICRLPRSTYV
jgi:hypothetical protein